MPVFTIIREPLNELHTPAGQNTDLIPWPLLATANEFSLIVSVYDALPDAVKSIGILPVPVITGGVMSH